MTITGLGNVMTVFALRGEYAIAPQMITIVTVALPSGYTEMESLKDF
jgi:hypothetical protein